MFIITVDRTAYGEQRAEYRSDKKDVVEGISQLLHQIFYKETHTLIFINEVQVLNKRQLSPNEISVTRALYKSGDRVTAIKWLREISDSSLKEAKDFADAMCNVICSGPPPVEPVKGVPSLGALLRSKMNQINKEKG